jgi:hypothetical protein
MKTFENRRGMFLAHDERAATTMLRLNSRQRDVLADKVPEVANIIMGAIVVAFVIGDFSASLVVLVGAFSFWAAALLFALWVMETRR